MTWRKGEFSETQKHNQQMTIHTSVPWTENKRAVCENTGPANEINQSVQVAKLTAKLAKTCRDIPYIGNVHATTETYNGKRNFYIKILKCSNVPDDAVDRRKLGF